MMRHLPNLICLARIALIWPIIAALSVGRHELALGLFVVAAVSDGVDGFLAKRFNWTSQLGKFLDPLADKLLLVAVFISGSWAGLVPWWLAAAAIARDLVIGGGALAALAIITLLSTLASGVDYVARFVGRAWSMPARSA